MKKKVKFGSGIERTYNIVNGTAYLEGTPEELIKVIDRIKWGNIRVKLCLGDTQTGKSWYEEHDIVGYISRSTGEVKVPIIRATDRSLGGTAIPLHNILKITRTKDRKVLYQTENYVMPDVQIQKGSSLPQYQYETYVDGQLFGRHKSLLSAQKLKALLT